MFGPYRWQLLASLVLVLATVGLNSVGPLLLRQVLNDALPRHNVRELSILCSAMIASGVLASLIGIGQGMMANRIGQGIVHDLRVSLFDHVTSMPLNFFAGDANTEIQARLVSDIGGISTVLTFTAQGALNAVVSLCTACAVMLLLNWPLALISMALALLLSLLNRRYSRRRERLATGTQKGVAGMLKLVAEDLSLPGVVLGRTLRRTDLQRARFVRASRDIGELTYQERVAGRTALTLITVTMTCFLPAIYWASGTIVPGITLGTTVVLATMQARLSAPIQYLLQLSGSLQSSRAMFRRIFEYLDLPGEARPVAAGPTAPAPADGHIPSLTFENVSYQYPRSENAGVLDLDAGFPPRTLTVITGHSGCGKSTLALLAAGLIAPDRGSVMLDGIEADGARLRETITLIPQEPILFNASVRENLLFARSEASDDELLAALAAASLTQLIARLPEGLDTAVGERGFQLSGGERQRLAFARALLADHRILVVDEATSALDGLTAEEIYQWLDDWSRRRSVILVTHRLPRLRPGTRVIVMHQNRVVEFGSHEQLLTRDGPYRRLLRTQHNEVGEAPLPPAVVTGSR